MNNIFRKIGLALGVVALILVGIAYCSGLAAALDVYGELKSALFEKRAGDPAVCTEGRVYYDTGSKVPRICNGTSWMDVSAAGAPAITDPQSESYGYNGGAELANTTGWATFSDCSATPTGAGGSPTAVSAVSRTTTSSEIISGIASFKLAQTGDASCEGWAYTITLASADLNGNTEAKPLELSFNSFFSLSASSNYRVYIRDVTNSTQIYGATLPTNQPRYAVRFVAAATAVTYRVIFKVNASAGTTTGAHTLIVDNLILKPSPLPFSGTTGQLTYGGSDGASIALTPATGVLHSSGAAPSWSGVVTGDITDGTIVNADVNASAAIDGSKIVSATNAVSGVVTTSSQNIAGLKTFYDGVKLDDDTSAGGTTTLNYYRESESTSATMSVNSGSGTLSGVSTLVRIARVGKRVTATFTATFTTSVGSSINSVFIADPLSSWNVPPHEVEFFMHNNFPTSSVFSGDCTASGHIIIYSRTLSGASNFTANTTYTVYGSASWVMDI